MKRLSKTLLLLSLLTAALAMTGCEEKGPAEKAGEKLDNMVDDSSDAIEDAADDIEDAADDAGDEIRDATN